MLASIRCTWGGTDVTRRRPVNGLTVIQLYAWHRRRDFRFEPIISVGPSRIALIAAPRIQRARIETSGRLRAIKPNAYVFVDPAQTTGGRKTPGDKSESPRPPQ